jgi:hypothetical protein
MQFLASPHAYFMHKYSFILSVGKYTFSLYPCYNIVTRNTETQTDRQQASALVTGSLKSA